MNVAIKKISQQNGTERFVLVDDGTRKLLTTRDTSEAAIRRYFSTKNIPAATIDECFRRARERYAQQSKTPSVNQGSETMVDDDLLFQLGLEEDNVH